MLRTGRHPTSGLRKERSDGVEIRIKGSFGADVTVGRAKNEVILCETAQIFLLLTFKNSFYTQHIVILKNVKMC